MYIIIHPTNPIHVSTWKRRLLRPGDGRWCRRVFRKSCPGSCSPATPWATWGTGRGRAWRWTRWAPAGPAPTRHQRRWCQRKFEAEHRQPTLTSTFALALPRETTHMTARRRRVRRVANVRGAHSWGPPERSAGRRPCGLRRRAACGPTADGQRPNAAAAAAIVRPFLSTNPIGFGLSSSFLSNKSNPIGSKLNGYPYPIRSKSSGIQVVKSNWIWI